MILIKEPKMKDLVLEANGTLYFHYNLQMPSNSLLLRIVATPGKANIALFISNETLYPSKENCMWSSHEARRKKLQYNEIEFNPFFLNKDNEIEYSVDAGVDVEERKEEERSEMIRIVLDGCNWKHKDKVCYIAMQNFSNEELKATLEVVESGETKLVSEMMLKKIEKFSGLFGNVSGGLISQTERSAKKLTGAEFIYGEVEVLHFIALLRLASKETGQVFWDLGCGTGKAMVAAAMSENDFREICGVELLEGLHKVASKAMERLCEDKEYKKKNFKLFKGDMKEVDWTNADIIYAASICFPANLIEALAEKGRRLKKGTKILTLKKWPLPEVYRVLYNLNVKMSWGRTGVYIMERI
eukprot:TRINITY_DN6018_c0_g3_i2.p1 TRINITY_DN6018_c0_g3~~TRINITY_DN6018_c0_g3_i2.p1  ORF type:complete len:357 (+),score=99.51 TRINITY_DN6018_c0_g3_i2:580-1650(+)